MKNSADDKKMEMTKMFFQADKEFMDYIGFRMSIPPENFEEALAMLKEGFSLYDMNTDNLSQSDIEQLEKEEKHLN